LIRQVLDAGQGGRPLVLRVSLVQGDQEMAGGAPLWPAEALPMQLVIEAGINLLDRGMAGGNPPHDGIEDQLAAQRQTQGGKGQTVPLQIQAEGRVIRIAGSQHPHGVFHLLGRNHHPSRLP
jgi:hypothetical protein